MQVMTVSAFVAYLNETFKAIWDTQEVAVEGEVTGFKVSQGQWVNFDLKDEAALVSAFMVLSKLQVPLQDGMRVRVFGYPRVYPKYGKFSFNVDRVEIVGEGSLRKALALLRQKLEQEGLFDPSRKRVLPRFPQRVALIASRESAAYGDFVRILNERWRGLSVDIYHVLVQGDGAPEQIVKAIERVNNVGYDALVLTRGGGSFEELMAFNDERVVRAIHASRVPTLVGIGHERDITLAEEAADVRGSTPTDCARRLVPDRTEVLFDIAASEERVVETLSQWIARWQERVAQGADSVVRWVHAVGDRLTVAQDRLDRDSVQWLSRLSERLASMDRVLNSLDPEHVLQRGFALVLDAAGRPRTSATVLPTGLSVRIRLRDGEVGARVTQSQAETHAEQPTLL